MKTQEFDVGDEVIGIGRTWEGVKATVIFVSPEGDFMDIRLENGEEAGVAPKDFEKIDAWIDRMKSGPKSDRYGRSRKNPRKCRIKRNPVWLAAIPLWVWITGGGLSLWGLSKLFGFNVPVITPLTRSIEGIGEGIPYLLGGTAAFFINKYAIPESQKGFKTAGLLVSLGLLGYGTYRMVTRGAGVTPIVQIPAEIKTA